MALLAAVLLSPASASAQCLKDARETKFGEGNAKVVTYLCKSDPAALGASIRVEFHRLSEAASAGLLNGKPWPEVEKILGKVRLLDNPVKREAQSLFKQFGITEEREDAFHFQAFAATGGEGSAKVSAGTGRRTFTYLTYPDTEGLTGQSMSLPEADKLIRTTDSWPKDFKLYYKGEDCAPENFNCFMLWRYFRAEDAAKFEERWKAQQAALPESDRLIAEPGEAISTPGAGPLKLIQHLTKDGWPDDFIVAVGDYNGCGGGYDFSYFPRQLIVDVAIVQNVSGKPITVGELLGSQVEGNNLRPPAAPLRGVVAAGIVPIPGAVGKLAPGERVLVPLKMSFVPPKGLGSAFPGKLVDARKHFATIEKLPPGTVIREKIGEEQGPLYKTRESFLPPELPKVTPYTWGPEITLKGIMVDGQRVVLDETSANFLELTAGEGYGSCPFLYSFDARQRTWVAHGKVIDKADAAAKELTQEVTISHFATRFRLSEEELEMALINRVALKVTLKNGTTLSLAPDDKRLQDADASYTRILAGRSIEISFALPLDLAENDVASSKLSVTGYYRRYSAMKIATHEPAKAD